jgi:hypothetical protein
VDLDGPATVHIEFQPPGYYDASSREPGDIDFPAPDGWYLRLSTDPARGLRLDDSIRNRDSIVSP